MIDVELDALREFYRAWVRLHSIPRDALHRKKQEAAAQEMVDQHHFLAKLYKPQVYTEAANG